MEFRRLRKTISPLAEICGSKVNNTVCILVGDSFMLITHQQLSQPWMQLVQETKTLLLSLFQRVQVSPKSDAYISSEAQYFLQSQDLPKCSPDKVFQWDDTYLKKLV